MSWKRYFEAVQKTLEQVAETQADAIEAAAELWTETIVSGGSLFAFGASHSFMVAEELVYRTGGLMLINPVYPHGMNLMVRPLTATSKLERVTGLGTELLAATPAKEGDALLIASTSGRNAVAIDMAIAARDLGLSTIGLTSMAYTSGVSSRHVSGKKLFELVDIVIDNGAPYGDAAVKIEGFPQPVSPLSSATGITIVNAIVAETVARLVERGVEPPVFMSANLDEGEAYNARFLAENRDRIHYLQ